MNRYFSAYQNAQNKIDYLKREKARARTREKANSYNAQINDWIQKRDKAKEKYEWCESRVKEKCGYPKYDTALYGFNFDRCIEFQDKNMNAFEY